MTDVDAPRATLRTALLLALCAGLFGCGGGITPVRTPFNKGVYQFTQGNHALAVQEYREALEEDPSDYRSRFNLALALEALAGEKRRTAQAAGDAASAQRLTQRATALEAEARGHYETVLEQRPGNLRAAVNLAALDYEKGETDAAKARLLRLIEEHPTVPLPRTALAANLLREARAANDPAAAATLRQAARDQLEVAVDDDTASLQARTLLGDLQREDGQWDAARETYLVALEREPSDPAIMMSMARTELGAGRTDAAVPWLRRILFLDRDAWDANLLLGRILGDQALRDGSRELAEEAVTHLWTARRVDALRPAGRERPDYEALLRPLYQHIGIRRDS